ncbi:non-ribosomal peptide synthetase [Paenibacillus zanthoxyli]|uniref:non-ribosomal peptide synthetase n=1 Tax=Paenibacillus zanthoxyli TaxID=369399 RepID=UPI00046FD90D|nr:non-ribosomal peptide synthetase [Paenibacillus zanthoxyli]
MVEQAAKESALQSVHGRISRKAEEFPEAEAVVFEGQFLNYGQLERRSNQVANTLIGMGIAKGDMVAVQMERGLDLIPALLGILKAGAVYVPIDIHSPDSRRKRILQETRAKVLITQTAFAHGADSEELPSLLMDAPDMLADKPDSPPCIETASDDLMYVIYTSGTTGEPKGVRIRHSGILNLFDWMAERYGMGSEVRVLHKAAYTFDASVWEIFLPLVLGGTLIIAKPDGYRNPSYLVDIFLREKVTTVLLVPSMLWHVLDEPLLTECRSLKHIFSGGERLSAELRDHFFSKLSIPLHNLYGPTEASILVTSWTCMPGDSGSVVPIGTPIDNMQLYVLDEYGGPAAMGETGELYIGGAALSPGYIGNPEENAKRFVANPDPQSPWRVLYRTGDLVRQHQGGILEYCGRTDEQVKINGFRIELGEIEACLRRLPQVRNAAVVPERTNDGRNMRLLAYLEASPEEITLGALRTHLSNYLPDYMIPARFKVIGKFPLSAHEKLDKGKLALLEGTMLENGWVQVKAKTDEERLLASMWCDLLGISSVGIQDDFFELGGDSIAVLKMVARCKRERVTVTPEEIFKLRTVEKIAGAIRDRAHPL